MPGDRVLIEIVTAANMAGVEEANAGFLGVNASTLALAASLGILVKVGNDAVKYTEEQDKANRSLKQATDAGKISFDALHTSFEAWAEANKRYIPDQYAAETALAAFVRAGNSATDSMRLLNIALDLSTLNGKGLEYEEIALEKAMMGSSKTVKDLGISTEEYNSIMKNKLLDTEQKHLALMTLIESKTKDGRKAQTDLTQSTQAMNKDWQDMTTRIGPPVIAMFSTIVDWADKLIVDLDNIGHNTTWNVAVSNALGEMQNLLEGVLAQWNSLINVINAVTGANISGIGPTATATGTASQNVAPTSGRRASGGAVMPGGIYTVGERGPETLVMGSSGGTVIPNGGPVVHVNIGTYVGDASTLSKMLAQELRITGAFR